MSQKHRGRIQAQGNGLELSESWSQDEPLTKEKGLDLLERLKLRLNKKFFLEREEQFEDAKRYIENIDGGIDAIKKKTFRNRKTKDSRIDIEVLEGTAFITILLIFLIYYFLQ
ncbi:MAG: hypothetical protein KDC85_13695 [Saprospiraceae bacterium]|nr:hypothetical protein [Saprospiraceae bacterium]MCB9325189.1 hypothetical protein [Lewinellaceae bacterium]